MEVCIMLHAVRQLTLIKGVFGTKSNAKNISNVRDDIVTDLEINNKRQDQLK